MCGPAVYVGTTHPPIPMTNVFIMGFGNQVFLIFPKIIERLKKIKSVPFSSLELVLKRSHSCEGISGLNPTLSTLSGFLLPIAGVSLGPVN